MWEPYICDIKGRNVELATWNTIYKPSIPIGSSFRKQRSTIFAHWGFGRGVSVGKTMGGGESSISEEAAVQRRMLLVCFCYFIGLRPHPPSLLQTLSLFYICAIWIRQIRISCSRVTSPSVSSCYFQYIVFNLIFFPEQSCSSHA